MSSEMTDEEMTDEQWRASRKEAGLKIDPETAEVVGVHADLNDPYGNLPRPPGGMPKLRAGMVCPFSRERHLGLVWRPAQNDPRRFLEKG
jgi:hypothetical protein